MRILIDADGCPVVDETLKIARQFALECLILCDTSFIAAQIFIWKDKLDFLPHKSLHSLAGFP